jgi:hypothetical protein
VENRLSDDGLEADEFLPAPAFAASALLRHKKDSANPHKIMLTGRATWRRPEREPRRG